MSSESAPVCIVDGLEAVDVGQGHAQGFARAPGAGQFLVTAGENIDRLSKGESSSTDSVPAPAPRRYAARRTQEGKSKPDIVRCLKRAIAREIHHALKADLADLIAHNRRRPAHTTVILRGNAGHGTYRQRT